MSMDKNIFRFNNGERDVYADPLVLRDRLFTVSLGEFWNLRDKERKIATANDDPTIIMEGIKAREHLIYIGREVFQMIPFDDTTGKGATAEECLKVTDEFLTFLAQKKTKHAPPPTTSPPTASTPQPPTAEIMDIMSD